MIHGEEKDGIGLGNVNLGSLISCPGHRGQNDFTFGKLIFDLL
jgi:hypothetical protein